MRDFEKNMKTRESVNERLSFFVFLKATFTKTAIKQKFVDGFSLKDFSAAIDQYTMKSPNFVSIENFLSCPTQAQNKVNIQAMSNI